MYMDWVYFSEIASEAKLSLTNPLVKLYLLGDMLDNRKLRNKTMQTLHDLTHRTLGGLTPEGICHIWENTSEGSMLRKWAIDFTVLRSRKKLANDVPRYPSDFVQQIAVKLMEQTQNISAAAFLARAQEYQEADDGA